MNFIFSFVLVLGLFFCVMYFATKKDLEDLSYKYKQLLRFSYEKIKKKRASNFWSNELEDLELDFKEWEEKDLLK